MTPTPRARRVLLLALALGACACTKHDGLILLDLRGSGPLVAPVVHIRLSAKGWPTRAITGTISPAGFLVGYYGPADGSAVTVTAEALDGVDCVLGKGSATVPPLAAGATSAPIKLFVRPVANECEVVDAGSDAGGEDAGGEDAAADAGADAADDAGSDAIADAETDAPADAGVDAGDDAGDDAGPDAGTD